MNLFFALAKRAVLSTALLTLGIGSALADQVYKHTLPDGRIIYSDKPPKGAKDWQPVIVPKPLTDAERAAAQKRSQEDARKGEEFRNRMNERRQRFDDANDKVASARKAVDDAEKALEFGRQPQPGDRAGVSGGGSRLNEEYFKRVSDLEAKVEAAKKELMEAQKERNNAR